MAPILGADGKPLAARGWYDTESLTQMDGMFYVGIERVEQIVRLDYRRSGLLARGEPIAVPPDFKTFTYNKSLECLAGPPKSSPLAGNLIVITERSLDSAGNHRAFLIKMAATRSSASASSAATTSTSPTARSCRPPTCCCSSAAIRRRAVSPCASAACRLASIKPDALVDGKALIEADLAYQIDNMEGIAVHRNARNETIITLVSDDNFSVIQRNLLLQFTLVGE